MDVIARRKGNKILCSQYISFTSMELHDSPCLHLHFFCIILIKQMKERAEPVQFDEGDSNVNVEFPELPIFDFEKSAMATNNFSPSNELGQGGFGLVYRVMVAYVSNVITIVDENM